MAHAINKIELGDKTFADKLNFLLERAGYVPRGRSTVIVEHTGKSKVAANNWLSAKSMPSSDNFNALMPLIQHCLERSGDDIDPKQVFYWLQRPSAANPFKPTVSTTEFHEVHDPVLIMDCITAIKDTLKAMGIPGNRFSPDKFNKLSAVVIKQAAQSNKVSNELIKQVIELALLPTDDN